MNHTWTCADGAAARLEGWDVFDAHTETGVEVQLQRLDEEEKFPDDADAMAHVMRRANEGSDLHRRAVAYVRQENPGEYAKMESAT
jgi:hypothetical protein